ncbi:MAG: PRC-barrel domain-containing protein [Candidatus Micrarchaeaceae archaeon]
MVKYIIAKQLVGKKVISTSGYDIGKFLDADINEITGKIKYMIVEANPDSSLASKLASEGSELKIPYNAVTAVADYIMVDTKNIDSSR